MLESYYQWNWTDQCEEAFCKVKAMIVSDLVLTDHDPHLPLQLACDASPVGIGAVLSHVMTDGTERPIAFASRSLSKAKRIYAQIDKEALATVWGVRKFHNYLFGRNFTLLTGHEHLTSIFHPSKSLPAVTAARYNATLCSWRVLTIHLDTRTLSYTEMRMVCLDYLCITRQQKNSQIQLASSMPRSLSLCQSQQNRSNEKHREILYW
jgi:hypothetical protein